MRIIAGLYGGRAIGAPNTDMTHPMSERVRSSLFNQLIDNIKNATVLDAFAGSGSLGLEAISRGACEAVFIEKDRTASSIIEKNIALLGVAEQAKIAKMNVRSWLNVNAGKSYDIIFADPPYNNMQLSTVALLVGHLKPNGLMILSYSGRGEVPKLNRVIVVDNRTYGGANLAFYHLNLVD